MLIIKKPGTWSVQDAPDRLFVDKGMLFCGFIDPERIYTLLYCDEKGNPCLKRFQIDKFILAIHDQPEFSEPELIEVIVRPWVADRVRMRPELRIVGHTGFIARARRRLSRKSLREFEGEKE